MTTAVRAGIDALLTPSNCTTAWIAEVAQPLSVADVSLDRDFVAADAIHRVLASAMVIQEMPLGDPAIPRVMSG